MKNYSAGKPIGNNNIPLYDSPPPFKAIGRFADENGLASSVVTLTHNTTAIEIATQAQSGIMRWITTSDVEGSVFANASIQSFDHVIPPNTVRRFVVPIESDVQTQSVQGANRANGLFRRVAYGTTAIGSVFLAEYGSSNSY